MPYTLKDPVRHKFTKKSYNVRDWVKYNEGLKNRGSLTIWFSEDAIAAWNHVQPDKRKRGGQRVYSDLAIETAHRLKWFINSHCVKQKDCSRHVCSF